MCNVSKMTTMIKLQCNIFLMKNSFLTASEGLGLRNHFVKG